MSLAHPAISYPCLIFSRITLGKDISTEENAALGQDGAAQDLVRVATLVTRTVEAVKQIAHLQVSPHYVEENSQS